MFRKTIFCLLAVLCLGASGVCALETGADGVLCFTAEDFSGEETLRGICITALPGAETGSLMLGNRTLRPGDILAADQLAQVTFASRTEEDRTGEVGYLPILETGVGEPAVMTLSLRGRENKAPVAEDQALETYKNLPLQDKLKVTDPEGETMTFTVTRQPRRGTVLIAEDGSFTYTPKKNKVGVDSFVYTATDASGKVSREATVTITLMKPTDATQYTDTAGRECRFAAEWMKNTGIFTGETLAGRHCFQPDKAVTRGEFYTMLVKSLDLTLEEGLTHTGYADEIPAWLQPYVAAAVRAGLTAGLPEQEIFDAEGAMTGAEAAVLLGNALNLTAADAGEEAADTVPVWARSAVTAMAEQGMELDAEKTLTRSDAALLLYEATRLRQEREPNRFEE